MDKPYLNSSRGSSGAVLTPRIVVLPVLAMWRRVAMQKDKEMCSGYSAAWMEYRVLVTKGDRRALHGRYEPLRLEMVQ